MTGIICSDCKSEIVDECGIIVDECGIFDGPNGVLCKTCFKETFKSKIKDTTSQVKKLEDSKSMNYFKVARERQNRELSNALLKSCEHITVECSRCPLNEKEDCAGNKMPPKPFEEDRHSICTDWIGIYFKNLVQNKKAK